MYAENNHKKRDPRNLIIVILLVVAVIAVGIALWTGLSRDKGQDQPHFEEAEEEKLTDTIALPQFAELDLMADTTEQTLTFENPARNYAYFRVSLVMDDETLWESELLAPGETSKPVVLQEPLAKGEYEVQLCYSCFSDEQEQNALNGAASPVKLIVR